LKRFIGLLCIAHVSVGKRNGEKGRWSCRGKDRRDGGLRKCISHEIVLARKMGKSGIEFRQEGKVSLLAGGKRC
jgi:hypothetical protein